MTKKVVKKKIIKSSGPSKDQGEKPADNNPLGTALIIIGTIILAYSLVSWTAALPKTMWSFLIGFLALIIGFSVKDKDFLKKNLQSLTCSMSNIRSSIVLIVLCDILLVLIVVGMLVFSGNYLNNKALDTTANSNLAELVQQEDSETAMLVLEKMKGLLISIIAIALGVLICIILFYSLFKGIIWDITYKVKPSVNRLLKFFLLNLFWLPVLAIFLVMLSVTFKVEFAAKLLILYFAVAIHLTIVLNAVFVHTGKVWQSLNKMFSIAFRKIQYFIIPYAAIIIVSYAVLLLSGLLRFIDPRILAIIMVASIMPLLMAISRVYISQVIKEQI
jgi:hypothetical protein